MSGALTDALATRRVWRFVFWFTSLVSAAPLFATRYLPFTDLPEHVAAMATLSDLAPGGQGAPYAFALGDSQYLLYHATGALLARAVGDAMTANRLLLFVVAIAWPVSFRSVLRALGRDERLALFVPMLFWSRALAVGFLPFVASVPIALWGLAHVVRVVREPTTRGWLGLAALAVALFYTHASTFLLFGVVTVVIAFASRAPLRVVAALGASLFPSALFALSWWRRGSLHMHHDAESMVRMSLGETLSAMPLWTFDIWRGHGDEAAAAMWWIAFATLLVVSLRRTPKLDRRAAVLAAPFAVTVALYFATPFSVGQAAYLNLRLAPMLALFALLWLVPSAHRLSVGALGVVVLASCVSALDASVQMRAAEREQASGLPALLARIPKSARLASVNFDARSARTKFFPYVYAGSYHRAGGGAQTGYSFAELPHWSVHYEKASQPPQWAPHWAFRPCEYRYRQGGDYFDFVLVQGRGDPFTVDHPGPSFRPVARAGVFTLYEKAKSPRRDADDAPDRSVCARPPPAPAPSAAP